MTTYPLTIEASHGAVIVPDEAAHQMYETFGFAPARRAGDTVYVSGVIAVRNKDEGRDAAAFEAHVARSFERLGVILAACGLTFADVVMINSFHVFDSEHFEGSRTDHIQAYMRAKARFVRAPYPAWTAVGTTGLFRDNGLVETQLIAQAR